MEKHNLDPKTWVDLYSDMLFRYASQRIPERDVARDLVQDTFVIALRTAGSYRGEVSEKNWLFIILKSRILDFYKKKKEKLASDFGNEEDESDFFNENGHWNKGKLPSAWSTDDAVRQEEFMRVFIECKNRLKEIQRLVFTMKFIDGEESETICKELEITASNYWILVHRAKLNLRQCLEKNWLSNP